MLWRSVNELKCPILTFVSKVCPNHGYLDQGKGTMLNRKGVLGMGVSFEIFCLLIITVVYAASAFDGVSNLQQTAHWYLEDTVP